MRKITKKELERLYHTMTNKDLATKLDLSHQGLIDLLREAGIELKSKVKNKADKLD